MNPDVIDAIKSQLAAAEDNLYRAKHATLACDPSQQWGRSGQTLNELIAGYDAEVARWKRALADVS